MRIWWRKALTVGFACAVLRSACFLELRQTFSLNSKMAFSSSFSLMASHVQMPLPNTPTSRHWVAHNLATHYLFSASKHAKLDKHAIAAATLVHTAPCPLAQKCRAWSQYMYPAAYKTLSTAMALPCALHKTLFAPSFLLVDAPFHTRSTSSRPFFRRATGGSKRTPA